MQKQGIQSNQNHHYSLVGFKQSLLVNIEKLEPLNKQNQKLEEQQLSSNATANCEARDSEIEEINVK